MRNFRTRVYRSTMELSSSRVPSLLFWRYSFSTILNCATTLVTLSRPSASTAYCWTSCTDTCVCQTLGPLAIDLLVARGPLKGIEPVPKVTRHDLDHTGQPHRQLSRISQSRKQSWQRRPVELPSICYFRFLRMSRFQQPLGKRNRQEILQSIASLTVYKPLFFDAFPLSLFDCSTQTFQIEGKVDNVAPVLVFELSSSLAPQVSVKCFVVSLRPRLRPSLAIANKSHFTDSSAPGQERRILRRRERLERLSKKTSLPWTP